MRHPRIILEGTGTYHVFTRVVDRAFKLDKHEKELMVTMMYQVAEFSGVHVLEYTIMDNHLHILLEVPERQEVSDPELRRRMKCLYGARETCARFDRWEEMERTELGHLAREEKEKMRARMYCLSSYMKTFKQRFSISYNKRHNRRGTLWEDRFSSVVIEPSTSVRSFTAAYITLNPIRAKIETDPAAYRWSGYAAAVAGNKKAREGLCRIYTEEGCSLANWDEVLRKHRVLLYESGRESRCPFNPDIVLRPGFSNETVAKILEEGGQLEMGQLLRCRVRYFTHGLILGSAKFLEEMFQKYRHHFGVRRKTCARKMKFLQDSGIRVARDLQVDVVTIPRLV